MVRFGNNTPHLSFLDLPAEARNWIYNARLRIVTKSGKRKALTVDEFRLRLQMLQPLLLANKQIMLEATPLFLGKNTLHLNAELRLLVSQRFKLRELQQQIRVRLCAREQKMGSSHSFPTI